jgi:ketosteroid isomerase-like protein
VERVTSDCSVQKLLDRAEIAEVIHAYCLHFDRAEVEKVVALFAEDAAVDYGPALPVLQGAGEIEAQIARGLAELFAATSHHVSNIMIAFDGPERAKSICHLYAWHRYRDRAGTSELWGQYHHEFRRTPEGWKISRLQLRAAGTRDFHRESMHGIGRRGA